MPLALDSSTPAIWNLSATTAASGTEAGTSASFTPPVGAWLYVSATINSNPAFTPVYNIPSNTGFTIGAWSLVKSQTTAAGGAVGVWRGRVTVSAAGTVTVSVTNTGASAGISNDARAWCDVWTGALAVQTGGATPIGTTSATQNISPSITLLNAGSRAVGVFIDWSATGSPTSADTISPYTSAGNTSGGRVLKGANGTGATTLNIVAGGAAPAWTYALYEVVGDVVVNTSIAWLVC